MKIAEEEDLWIGDSGALTHMMGCDEHVFNKKFYIWKHEGSKWCSHEDAV